MQREHKIIIGVLIAILIIGIVVTFLISTKTSNQISEEAINTFSNQEGEDPYTDLNGNPVSLDAYLGKYLVVTSWASWSPFSTSDLQNLNEIAQDYSSDEIVFLAINRKETKEQAARFMATLPDLNKLVFVLDPRDNFYKAVGGYAMPEVVIYNQNAEVINHYRGVVEKEELKEAISLLTAE